MKKDHFINNLTWKRMLIILAGPVFNFLLAVLIFIIVLMYGLPNLTAEVGEVQKESAAFEAGMINGDKIISIDGHKIVFWEEIKPIIADSKGKEVNVVVERETGKRHLLIKPRLSKSKNIFGEEVPAYIIGIAPSGKIIVERKNPWDAIFYSVNKTWEISKITIISVVKMFEGVISPRTSRRSNFYCSSCRCSSKGRHNSFYSIYGYTFH